MENPCWTWAPSFFSQHDETQANPEGFFATLPDGRSRPHCHAYIIAPEHPYWQKTEMRSTFFAKKLSTLL
jgi:hypothetical protein